MAVIDWAVYRNDLVVARDGELGRIAELFVGPPRSMFISQERYLRVTAPGQPDLYVPAVEIVDVNPLRRVVHLKLFLNEIDAQGWTRDPRRSADGPPPRYQPRPQPAMEVADGRVQESVRPRPRGETGAWQPGEVAPRPEPRLGVRIGDRFRPGDPIPVEGQYLCTVCATRKHSRQFREQNPDGRFPQAHHPGGLWELEDLRP